MRSKSEKPKSPIAGLKKLEKIGHKTTQNKRVKHNAFERARRLSLNNKFVELSQALPTLETMRRPSKAVIVQKALEYVHVVKSQEDYRDKELERLQSENEQLLREKSLILCELNEVKGRYGLDSDFELPKREEVEGNSSIQAAVVESHRQIVEEPMEIASSLAEFEESSVEMENDVELIVEKKKSSPKRSSSFTHPILPKDNLMMSNTLFMDRYSTPTAPFDIQRNIFPGYMMFGGYESLNNPSYPEQYPGNELFNYMVPTPPQEFSPALENTSQSSQMLTLDDLEQYSDFVSNYSESASEDFNLPTPTSQTFDQTLFLN